MKLSIVIPCHNEEACLETLHRRVAAAARTVAGEDFECILIDDGSKDRTWPMLATLSVTDPHVVAVALSRNHGHQLALTAGLTLAKGDFIFVIDADLQDPPELLAGMMEAMRAEGADVVYGQRRSRAGETLFKRATAKLFYRLLRWLSDIDVPLDAGDFRLMTRRALDVLLSMPEHHRFVRGMVAWIGFTQVPFPYDREERFGGETSYPLSKMLRLTFDAITGFSTAPLRIASHIGMWLAVAGLGLIVYTIISWFGGEAIRGWTSLMAIVVTLGSAQMLLLGLMGEYLGRMYMETKDRPLFVIREVRGAAAAAPPERADTLA